MRRRDGKAWKAEALFQREQVERLNRLIVAHHDVMAMKGLKWGEACPVCKAEREGKL